jgi:plastocyanin
VRKSMALRAVTVASLVGMASGVPTMTAAQVLGTIEGTVQAAPPQPRRSAIRYPGGGSEAHAIAQLPVVVYLVGSLAGSSPEPSALRATMTQRDTAFAPSVVSVRAGGTVSFPNGDPFFHNVFSYSSAQRFDLGRYPQGESKDVTFPEPGIIEVFCEVHEFMRGAILVVENPHHAIVGTDGRFRLSGVPPGEHTIAFWHPDHEPLQQRVVVVAGSTARVEASLRR